MQPRSWFAFGALMLSLCGCAGATSQNSDGNSQLVGTVGNAAQRPALVGPPGCTRAIADYETIIDRDVTTGYLSQGVYDQIVGDIAAGPRAACAAGREADARTQLARVKSAHGYR